MKYDNEYKIFLDTWGIDSQERMAIEEMGELIQALCKHERYKHSPEKSAKAIENIKEEIADVLNMVEQLQYYYGAEEIDKIRQQKIDRTSDKMKKW